MFIQPNSENLCYHLQHESPEDSCLCSPSLPSPSLSDIPAHSRSCPGGLHRCTEATGSSGEAMPPSLHWPLITSEIDRLLLSCSGCLWFVLTQHPFCESSPADFQPPMISLIGHAWELSCTLRKKTCYTSQRTLETESCFKHR